MGKFPSQKELEALGGERLVVSTVSTAIAYKYDASKQPYWEGEIEAALKGLKELPTGAALLKAITLAKPECRKSIGGTTWPNGINVIISPPGVVFLTQKKANPNNIDLQGKASLWEAGISGEGLVHGGTSKTGAKEADWHYAYEKSDKWQTLGGGSVASIAFSNTEMRSATGGWMEPHITMGHELIHCLHSLLGTMKNERTDSPRREEEEYYTVGLMSRLTGIDYEGSPYTENHLRREADLGIRLRYYPDD